MCTSQIENPPCLLDGGYPLQTLLIPGQTQKTQKTLVKKRPLLPRSSNLRRNARPSMSQRTLQQPIHRLPRSNPPPLTDNRHSSSMQDTQPSTCSMPNSPIPTSAISPRSAHNTTSDQPNTPSSCNNRNPTVCVIPCTRLNSSNSSPRYSITWSAGRATLAFCPTISETSTLKSRYACPVTS